MENIIAKYQDELIKLERSRKTNIFISRIFQITSLLFFIFLIIFIVFSYKYTEEVSRKIASLMQGVNVEHFSYYITGGSSLIMILLVLVLTKEKRFQNKIRNIVKNIAQDISPHFVFADFPTVKPIEIIKSEVFQHIKRMHPGSVQALDSFDNETISIKDIKIRRKVNPLNYIAFLGIFLFFYRQLRDLIFVKTSTDTIENSKFEGAFIKSGIKKKLNGHTIILPDNIEKHLGVSAKIIQKKYVKNRELVKLEDPDFERNFVVYSSDQVEARYILSPSMMYRINFLREKLGKPFMMSFTNNTFYMAIPSRGGFFGLPKHKKVTRKLIEDLYFQIKISSEIGEELKLN